LDPGSSNSKPKPNKLILSSFILGFIPAVAIPFAVIFPSLQFYMLFLLPFGLGAALLALIALDRIKHGLGSPHERTLAVIAYFLGLSPVLYFCGIFTYQLLSL
jgi:hypothetical protein